STLGVTGADGARWALVWDGVDVDSAVGDRYRATLSYGLRVTPQMAEVSTTHTNTASVISYVADTNDGGERTYFPADGPSYTGRPPAADRVPAQSGRPTTDPSHVRVAGPVVTKGVTSPSGTNNGTPSGNPVGTQVAIGEWATYTYGVRVPARTSVVNGSLTDALPTLAHWEIDAAATTVTYPGGTTAPGATSFLHGGGTFTVNPAAGTLTFPTGTFTTGTSDETFTVTLTARVRPSATWTHSTSTARTNTATFRSGGTSRGTATARTFVIEPDPRISKVADDDTIVAEQVVTYTLQAWNASGRPTSFGTVVVDCVPAGLAVQTPVTAPTG